MDALSLIPIWLVAIPLAVLILCGGLYLWKTRFRRHESILSDQETVWLLIGLLVIALVCFIIFLFVVL
jgi:hypothetical protein